VYRFAYREHGTAYWVVSVRNTSRFDIRVTGLDVPGGRDDGLFRFAGLRLTPAPNVIGWQDARPFHPTTVPAGSELPLVVVLRIGNCRWNSYGGVATTDSVRLRYTLFGVLHRSETVKVGSAVSVAAPRASACPER
jgi:hypothetical protein